jgi:hypothetical protein
MHQGYGHYSIGEDQLIGAAPQRKLIEKNQHVNQDQTPCHPGQMSARPWEVLEGYHLQPPPLACRLLSSNTIEAPMALQAV